MTNILFLGVVNATPNSFSDGHRNLDNDFQIGQLEKFQQAKYGLDIGAESTAPFNESISFKQEWQRLDEYISQHLDRLKAFKTISIDTYKVETMEEFMHSYGHHFSEVIWNDVSGAIDKEGLALLKKYPKMRYILCHNLAPKRSLANYHMDYLNENLDFNSIREFFNLKIAFLNEHNFDMDRLILDPCFGFSKTLNQNLELLENIHKIQDIHENWLIGISKKSFLQHLVRLEGNEDEMTDIHTASEKFHWKYLKRLKTRLNGVKQLYFRVHEAGNITD